VVAIGGCGSSGGSRGEPGETSTSTPAHLATGVIPPPPLSPRFALSVVPVGRYVVALGGYTLEDDHQFAADDGAVFDRAAGKWAAIAPPPFAEPLFRPAVVPTGDRLIVVGALCREASIFESEREEPLCPTDVDFVAASYDPSADHWAVLPTSDLLTTARGDVGASAIGWTDPRAVFGVLFERRGYIAYNAETKDWERIATPEDIPDICTTSDAILAIAQPETSPRDIEYGASRVATFVFRDGVWRRSAQEPQPAPDQLGSITSCGTGVEVYAPFLRDGKIAATSFFSSDRVGWRQLPAVDIPEGTFFGGAVLGDGTQVLMYSDRVRQHVFSRSAADPTWSERHIPEYNGVEMFAVAGNEFLLVPGDPLKDGLFIGTG
jgi:hypothetical protein